MTRTVPILRQDAMPSRKEASAPTSKPTTKGSSKKPIDYAEPFCDFLTYNPTVFHAVSALGHELHSHGYQKLSERGDWSLKAGGKYFLTRNSSSLIAFHVGAGYKPGNGVAMVAGHIDNVTTRLKPVGKVENRAGYLQLGVAPYAGGLGKTWWDRDLGIAGRVIVKTKEGKVVERLVDLREPIARIPTLAEHFGAPAAGPFNQETQMVPIIGLDGETKQRSGETTLDEDSFVAQQPPRLVKAIASKLGIEDHSQILNWDLDLYDIQPAVVGGLDKEFIYGGRIDDKLCSWAATQALLESDESKGTDSIKLVALFDDEEIGSLLRQGARGNFLPSTIQRIVENFGHGGTPPMGQTFANSFLVSADVIHAINPNFTGVYLPKHAPALNYGVAVSCDPNGHMTTDAVSTTFLDRVADKCGSKLGKFQIRNDSRSGGTVGPMLSSAMGCRAIDAGCPQLSMHSIRATTGSLDPGLGVQLYRGFYDYFEEVDGEFRDE